METIKNVFIHNRNKVFGSILLIVLLLFTINVVSVNNLTLQTMSKVNLDDSIKITIDKSTSDDEISSIMTSLKEQGIIAEFKNIKRNENNEIISIKINITKNGSTSSYNASSNLGIDSILIDINGDFVNIHNQGIYFFGNRASSDDEIKKIMQMQRSLFNNHFNDIEVFKKMLQQQSQLFSNLNIDDNNNDDLSLFFSNGAQKKSSSGLIREEDYDYHEETKTTYIVNGKAMVEEAYNKMDKSKINSLEIKKEIITTYSK